MQIKDIMTTDVSLVAPSASLTAAAIMMREKDIGMLPVGENDRLVGSVTDRDITIKGTAENRSPVDTKVRDVMSEKIVYSFEDEPVQEAARKMGEQQVRRLPVLNRDKRLVGIVALGDVAAQLPDPEPAGEALGAVSRG